MNIKLEDLEINNYKIYQDKDSFNFGIDAVLLSNFALRMYGMVGSSIKICDLCAGSIPIPLIMYAKRNQFLKDDIHIDAFEIDKDSCDLANKSLDYNKENIEDAVNIKSHINIYHEDIKNIITDKEKYKYFYDSYDMITVNPPYMKQGSAIINLNDKKVVARHEVSITFEEIVKVSSLLLKSNKKLYIINHSERFTEISDTLKKHSFEIKKAEFIYPSIEKPSNLVLIEAVKDAREGIKILEPVVIYDDTGNYTEKVLKIYGK